jgi:antitoxin component of RelBE/YafQ-DinJ toxin-antitoxin module
MAMNRQISIRLDEEAYQALVNAARMYGVAPSTMGRLLVAKGARKAVEAG